MRRLRRMRRGGISYVPAVLGIVGLVAMLALVDDRNVRTWAIVIGLNTVAAVGYAAYQEQRANRAVSIARRRVGAAPFDELLREMDRSRRHERPFAIARVRPPHSSAGTNIPATLRQGRWRSTDRTWRQGRDVYVLLPETNVGAAGVAIDRALTIGVAEGVDVRIAAFPESGITVGSLFEVLGAAAPRSDEVQVTEPVRNQAPLEVDLELVPVRRRSGDR